MRLEKDDEEAGVAMAVITVRDSRRDANPCDATSFSTPVNFRRQRSQTVSDIKAPQSFRRLGATIHSAY